MNIQFGFSGIGFLFIVMLMIPNLLWIKHQPKDYQNYVGNENKLLVCLERIGEIGVSCLAVCFNDCSVFAISLRTLLLAAAFVLMLMYEWFWIRYFRSNQTMQDFYCTCFQIPVPGAVLPVAALFLLALYESNLYLLIAVVVLGIGHIGIHLQHRAEVTSNNNQLSS